MEKKTPKTLRRAFTLNSIKPLSVYPLWFGFGFSFSLALTASNWVTWSGESASPDCLGQRFKLALLSAFRSAAATEPRRLSSGTAREEEEEEVEQQEGASQ